LTQACESVEQDYLMWIMKRMNFPEKWRSWVMERISSVSISVLLNGSPIKDFGKSRGLPQGDPLFPFLFPIVNEELNS